MSGSKDPHKFDALAEYDHALQDHIDALNHTNAEIFRAIQRVQDGRYRELLLNRYLRMMTWEQIAVEMNYTWRRVLQLHGNALKAVEPFVKIS